MESITMIQDLIAKLQASKRLIAQEPGFFPTFQVRGASSASISCSQIPAVEQDLRSGGKNVQEASFDHIGIDCDQIGESRQGKPSSSGVFSTASQKKPQPAEPPRKRRRLAPTMTQ
jgi:hypothetical protein